MLNPMTAWEPGLLVRYHGSHTDLHGTYHAYPCDCLNCDNPRAGTVRFRLTDPDGRTAVTCVRARSITPTHPEGQPVTTRTLMDRIVAEGGDHYITLTDGHQLVVSGRPGCDEFDEVFLHPGLDVTWEHEEDRVDLHLSGDPRLLAGRLFIEVPADDVTALIDQHGGGTDI